MRNVLIRDVPDDVHADLRRRADRAGQSLQQFLSSELVRIARAATLDEVLDRIDRRQGGSVGFGAAVSDLDDERSRS